MYCRTDTTRKDGTCSEPSQLFPGSRGAKGDHRSARCLISSRPSQSETTMVTMPPTDPRQWCDESHRQTETKRVRGRDSPPNGGFSVPSVSQAERNKKGAPNPRPLPEPRPRGTSEQHLADAPFRERGPSTASEVEGPCGPAWSVSGKQFLTLARRSNCRFAACCGGGQTDSSSFVFLLVYRGQFHVSLMYRPSDTSVSR